MTLSPEERAAWVGLHLVKGIGPVRFRRLLDHFGSAREAWTASPKDLEQAGVTGQALPGRTPTIPRG